MGSIIFKEVGTLTSYNSDKGFAFVKTAKGDVHIAASLTKPYAGQLRKDARVHVQFVVSDKKGGARFNALQISKVEPPEQPVEVLAVVQWFDYDLKKFGFVELLGDHDFSKSAAFLHRTVCDAMEFKPDPGDKLRVSVIENGGKPRVDSFQFGADIDAAVDAFLGVLHAEDGAVTDDEADEQSDSVVDEVFEQHKLETQQAIGQLPPEPEVVETPVEAAPAKRKTQRRAPKAEAEHGRTKASRKRAHATTPTDELPAETPQPLDLPIEDPEPTTLAAAVAACAINGSGGAMAAELKRAAGIA